MEKTKRRRKSYALKFRDVLPLSGLNGSVVYATDCYPKGAGFDSRVMLGVFPSCKRG
jgi:hypothetical protein